MKSPPIRALLPSDAEINKACAEVLSFELPRLAVPTCHLSPSPAVRTLAALPFTAFFAEADSGISSSNPLGKLFLGVLLRHADFCADRYSLRSQEDGPVGVGAELN